MRRSIIIPITRITWTGITTWPFNVEKSPNHIFFPILSKYTINQYKNISSYLIVTQKNRTIPRPALYYQTNQLSNC